MTGLLISRVSYYSLIKDYEHFFPCCNNMHEGFMHSERKLHTFLYYGDFKYLLREKPGQEKQKIDINIIKYLHKYIKTTSRNYRVYKWTMSDYILSYNDKYDRCNPCKTGLLQVTTNKTIKTMF